MAKHETMVLTKEKYLAQAKVEQLGNIPPKAVFENKGEWLGGKLESIIIVPAKGTRKEHKSYNFSWLGGDVRVVEGKEETPITPKDGMIVRMTGAFLDASFGAAPEIGAEYVITFLGLGEKRGGNNPAKQLTVELVRRS